MLLHLYAQFLSFSADVMRLAIWLALLVAIFVPLERAFALHPAKIWRKQFGVDLAWYFINTLFPATVVAVSLSGVTQGLHRLDPGGYYSAVGAWPFWLRLPLMLFVSDLGVYWGHRALHQIPLLWRFHAIHHSAEEMDWLVNTRAHPFDMILVRVSGLTPMYLLGLATVPTTSTIDPAVALAMIVSVLWNFFIHSNVRFRLGPLESLISSPMFHHWHHCNDQHRHTNYAFIFPFIDRIFGTAWMPGYWPAGYGVEEKISTTLVGQFLDPIDPSPARVSNPAEEKTVV